MDVFFQVGHFRCWRDLRGRVHCGDGLKDTGQVAHHGGQGKREGKYRVAVVSAAAALLDFVNAVALPLNVAVFAILTHLPSTFATVVPTSTSPASGLSPRPLVPVRCHHALLHPSLGPATDDRAGRGSQRVLATIHIEGAEVHKFPCTYGIFKK